MPEPPHIDIFKTVFPVAATEADQPGELARPDFFGTAFCVAPGVFMTAAHVALAASAHGHITLAGPSGEGMPMGGARVSSFEHWPDHDIALLYCDAPATALNVWMTHRVQVLMDMSSFGYPHAVTRADNNERFEVVFRAYKGHVITTRGFERLPNRPAVYEISTPYPEGLSGAPVLLTVGDHLAVAGVVLGVSEVEYGGVLQRVGIAMIADEIVNLTSQKLGGAVGPRLNFDGASLQIGDIPVQ